MAFIGEVSTMTICRSARASGSLRAPYPTCLAKLCAKSFAARTSDPALSASPTTRHQHRQQQPLSLPCKASSPLPTIIRRRQANRAGAVLGSCESTADAILPGWKDVTTASHRKYSWNPFRPDRATEEAQSKFREIPPEVTEKAAREQIDRVEKAMREMAVENEDFAVRRDEMTVYIDLSSDIGSYYVVYDRDNREVCMMSPKSGTFRYILDAGSGRWIGKSDRHDLEGMLTRDIIKQAYGIPNFDTP